MSTPSYRPEDEFKEHTNAAHLKKMFKNGDYQGVLDMALVLNHQAFFNNSRAHWAIQEAAKNMSEEFAIEKYQKIVEDLA
jgi:hypothetical protein